MKSVIQWYKRIAIRVRKMPTILAIIVAFTSSGAAIYGQGLSGVPAIPLEGGVYYDYNAPPVPAAQSAVPSGPVAASYDSVVTQPEEISHTDTVATDPTVAVNPTGPFEKRGDYYVRTTDRYGNPKYDLDEYSPGILPQPMGAMPNSGPERIDPRTLQPSGPKGAAGDTILNSPGCQLCGGGYSNPKLWSFEVGAKILHREAPEHIQSIPGILGYVSNIPRIEGYTVEKDNSFDIATGLDIRAKRYLGRNAKNVNFFLEFEYWGLNEWNMTNRYLFYGRDSEGESVIEEMEYKVRSTINSFELNLRVQPRGTLHDRMVYLPNGRVQRQCRQGWSGNMLVGIRYFDQNDKGFLRNLTEGYYLDCEADNNMLGFQLGVELIDQHCMWNWGINGKIAPLYNWSDRTYTISGSETAVKAAEGQLAGLADVGLWVNYRFTKRLTGRFQYNVMWVTGVAQATSQIVQGANDRYAIDNDTTEFLQGLTVSMEYAW
ncbi:MAG: hypothetical protein IJG38_09850 [Thermoguttaceae bacterium]|nr:hypothetical protein [Thermoguttaceae bacterium]